MTQNVFNSAYPLLFFLKSIGIFVPSIRHSGQYEISTIDKIYFAFINCMLFALLMTGLIKPRNKMSSSLLIATAWELSGYFANVCSIILIMYQYRKSMKCVRIMQVLNEFDLKVTDDANVLVISV